MKTIAISIDEASLQAIDRLARAGGRARRPGRRAGSRSEIVRRAVQEFIARQQRHAREEQDRRILATHRERLGRQATALVAEQAEP
jgi:metal-responsive CopG/Arc/MetJ family transcriptional regulator